MLSAYLGWVRQVKEALLTWGKYSVRGDFDKVVVAGMGGSGVVGDYVQALSFHYGRLPIYTLKSHLVPRFVDEKTLFVAISYSGNTTETLQAFRKAFERRSTIVAISSGGLLREEALRKGALHIPLPAGLLPRVSLPVMLYSTLGLLDSSGYTVVPREDAMESAAFLEDSIGECIDRSSGLSEWLYTEVSGGGFLVIATHSPLEPIGIRGKNEFNENSKLLVKVDVAPEWMHNDVVGYEKAACSKLCVIGVVDPDDAVGYKLVKFMEKVYTDRGYRFFELKLRGRNMLEKLMYGSLVLGLTSVMLAEKLNVDPARTNSIELYKKSVGDIFA